MTGHILSIGDLVLDIILPVHLPVDTGDHQVSPAFRVEPGGAGNFIITARQLGVDVSVTGTVGKDLFGRYMLEVFQQYGADTEDIVITPGSTTSSVVALADIEQNKHVFLGYYGEGERIPYSSALADKVHSVDAVFIAGYTLAEKRLVDLVKGIIEDAKTHGVPIYLDVGPFFRGLAPQLIEWILDHADVVLVTEDEVPFASKGMSGKAAVEYLLSRSPRILVIKRGPAGCDVFTPEEQFHVDGFAVDVVDTIGAGDCFDAAFIAGRLKGLGLRDAALLANAAGAVTVTKLGAGTNAPTCQEVMALLQASHTRVDFSC